MIFWFFYFSVFRFTNFGLWFLLFIFIILSFSFYQFWFFVFHFFIFTNFGFIFLFLNFFVFHFDLFFIIEKKTKHKKIKRRGKWKPKNKDKKKSKTKQKNKTQKIKTDQKIEKRKTDGAEHRVLAVGSIWRME